MARLALAACVLAAVLLRLALWMRSPADLDAMTLIDDSYLALHLARSIADGLGPLYGLAPTNGFQPLYVFAIVPAFTLFPHDADTPIRAALALNALFDLLTLWALVRLVRASTRGGVAVPAAALLWAVNPYVLKTGMNGLETSIACFMLALLLGRIHRIGAGAPLDVREGARLGALFGLSALARIDLLLAAPIALVVVLRARAGARTPWPRMAAAAVASAVAALAVVAPWLAYSCHWTGSVFPVSGRAVRYMELANVDHAPTWAGFFAPMLAEAAGVALRWNGVLLAAVAASTLLLAARGGIAGAARRVAAVFAPLVPGLLFGLVLFAAYACVVFGHWHFPRYLFPLTLPLTWAFARCVDAVEGEGAVRMRGAAIAITLATALALCLQPPFARLFGPAPSGWGYRQIGIWAREAFPAGTRIGASQSGALGYFADSLVVVNLDGVVNRDIHEAMRAGRALDYVRNADLDWLVWQDDIEWLIRETHGASPGEIVHAGIVPGIRTFGEPWNLYRVADAPGQSDASSTPPGAGPSAASEQRSGVRNSRAASSTDSRVTAITLATSSSIVQNSPR
jgi:hypothetical protein